MNLRSPYDTGKPQLIKEVMNKYDPKRVLWISTRITYTFDILKTFEEDFGFKKYHENDFKADRIVIQLESLWKLQSPFLDDLVPVYDLIILDEVESILKQFSSEETFKDRARSTFEFLQHIIYASLNDCGKIISMDGDLGNRAMHFLNKFGTLKNIINRINFNDFHMTIHDRSRLL